MNDVDRWVERVYAAGGDREQLNRLYEEWAADYDQHKWASGNPSVAITVGVIARHLPDFDACVLDAGCGTGNLGQVLHQIGYRNIEGLDPSPGMLEMARRKEIYQALYPDYLEPEIDLAKRYDLVAATGIFTEGHAPPEALEGMLRLARPGAVIAFSLSELAEHELGFAARITELSEAGAWHQIERTEPYRGFPFSETATVHLRVWAFRKSEADQS